MLSGKSAMVTGSTSGIGLLARALAGHGANVMLNGFGDADEIERTGQNLKAENNVKVIYSGANIAVPTEIAGMIQMADHELGGVDILVDNASIQHVAPIEEFPIEKWDAILAINLSGAFHTRRLTVPRMNRKTKDTS
jgi:3-hydroxybutyrate dehydrogenase